MSAARLEARTGGTVTRQTVADLDCGRQRDVRLSQALALADALDTKLQYLLNPEIDPTATKLPFVHLREARRRASTEISRQRPHP